MGITTLCNNDFNFLFSKLVWLVVTRGYTALRYRHSNQGSLILFITIKFIKKQAELFVITDYLVRFDSSKGNKIATIEALFVTPGF